MATHDTKEKTQAKQQKKNQHKKHRRRNKKEHHTYKSWSSRACDTLGTKEETNQPFETKKGEKTKKMWQLFRSSVYKHHNRKLVLFFLVW